MCDGWTEKEKRIYAGLKDIGGEAAGYFKSALNYYYNDSFPNRVSHLAHAAREIDGGLRDVFSSRSLKKKIEQNLINKSIETIFGKEFITYRGHIASILAMLNVNEKDALAKEWLSVASQFSKYAHRHGVWKEPRSFMEFKSIWERYEDILDKLVGYFYSIIARLDGLISIDEASEAPIGTLLNLIKIRPYSDYFFKNVKSTKWFEYLKDKNFFTPETIFDAKGSLLFWNILDYFEFMSLKTQESLGKKYAKDLLDIINNTVLFSVHTIKINNYHVWWHFVKTLNNIPIELIIDNNLTLEKFKVWLEEWTNSSLSGDLAISDIVNLLLGKFLKNYRTVKHAEAIIKVITHIKKKGKKDSFGRSDEAKMTWSSYWTLEGLEKNRKIIAEKCSNDVIFDIADKLNLALKYKQMDYSRLISDKEDICRLKVYRLEKEGLKEKEIGFKEGYFRCIIEQYEPEQLKGLEDIHNNLFQLHYKEPKKKIEDNILLKEVRNAEDFIAKLKPKLPDPIKWDNVEELDKKLESIYEGFYEDYSQIWFRSLADSGDVHENDAEGVLAIILRDILVNKCEAKRDEGEQVLEEFLTNRYKFPLFRRMVLYCMYKFWENYKDLFDRFLEVVPDVLDHSDYEVEFYDILEKYNKDLGVERLKRLIENVPEYYRKEGPKHEAYWRYKWLSALKDNDAFKELYEKVKKDAELKEDKPYEPRRSAFMGGMVTHKTPIVLEEILQMEVSDLIKFMQEFKGTDMWGTFEGKPDIEGLVSAFQAAVKENPKKFTDDVELFKEVDYRYKNSLLRGFLDAWKSNKDIDWEKIFNFCEDYIRRPTFVEEVLKAQGEDSGEGRYIWLFDTLCDLIEDGSRTDDRSFNDKYFSQIEELYSIMLEKVKGDPSPDAKRDAVTYALNTTLGRLIRSYIIFSLHVSRVNEKRQEDWGKNKYDRFFEKGIEAYIWFGMFLPNMTYLDKEWVKRKLQQLKDKGVNDLEWQKFMEAYLFGSNVYDDIYKLMREHYKMAIDTKVFDAETERRLVQHVAIGYLRGLEELSKNNKDESDSLFWKVLDEIDIPEKRDRWEEVAMFFWSVTGRSRRHNKEYAKDKEGLSEEFKKKILDFWKWTYDKKTYAQEKLGDAYPSFLGRMAKLTILFPKIDNDAYEWLMLSAPHIELHHNSSLFIEYLIQFVEDDESVRHIGTIFREMLKNATPDYKREDIIAIVDKIFQVKGGWEDAAEICNTYGRRGVHFLKDTFFKYQENKH